MAFIRIAPTTEAAAMTNTIPATNGSKLRPKRRGRTTGEGRS